MAPRWYRESNGQYVAIGSHGRIIARADTEDEIIELLDWQRIDMEA
jgi:hypothetical protein